MIAVIDYGMGNLRSVQKALELVGSKTKVTSRPSDLAKCDKLVLPGVGAFGDAMRELKRCGLIEPIKDAIKDGKPFLGLCLGMQLLFDKSDEAPGVKGLGILKGEVRRFKFKAARRSFERSSSSRSSLDFARDGSSLDITRDECRASPRHSRDGEHVEPQDQIFFENLKVPHMGWNGIVHSPQSTVHSLKILKGVPDGSYVYFVHSYYTKPKDKKVVLTTTDYGIKFASGVCKENVYGLQFHPEKSQALGLKILENFVRLK